MPRFSARSRQDVQLDASLLLQVADDAEQIAGLGIAARSEHADQTLRRCVRGLAELLGADRCLDVIAEDRLAGINVAGQHRVDAFAQQEAAKSGSRATRLPTKPVKLLVDGIAPSSARPYR